MHQTSGTCTGVCACSCVHQMEKAYVWFLRYMTFGILSYFLPFYPPNNPENQNFEKMKKNAWRYHFAHVYHKVRQTEFFLILVHFLSFYQPNNPENQDFE